MELNKVVADAKAKTNDHKWIRAIDRAATALVAGELSVTVLADSHALVTSSNGSYWVNGSCQCKAAKAGHKECYHRAAARLVELYEATPATKPARQASTPRIVRSIERDPRNGTKYTVVTYDGWAI